MFKSILQEVKRFSLFKKWFKKALIKKQIPLEKKEVVQNIYNMLSEKYGEVELLDYNNETMLLSFNRLKVYVDLKAILNFYEIFVEEMINFVPYVDLNAEYNVIDIGANRGYTVLNWASQQWCNKVFAYECVPETFRFLLKNVNINTKVREKVQLNAYGLSDSNSDLDIYSIKNYDLSATSNLELLKKTWPKYANDIVDIKCKMRRASEIIANLINSDFDKRYILKIDVEGSEYKIFKDLINNSPSVFDKIETMFIETHLGYKKIDRYIESLNKNYILDSLYVNGDNIHMLVYTKLTKGYWARKFYWTKSLL